MTGENTAKAYPKEPKVQKGELPDLFALPEGGRVSTKEQWEKRSRQWRDTVIDIEYGGMPPAPESVEAETLCHNRIRRLPGAPRNWSYRIHCSGGEKPFNFCARVLFPQTEEPIPAVITGDGCWWDLSANDILRRVTDSKTALVIFNRTEMAEDLGHPEVRDRHRRSGGLYEAYPGMGFGALSAWAWGYHRVVDFLRGLPFIDSGRIAVTGHSRGGKTALVAGATDERISIVNDNASCAAGSAVFRYVGHGGETLDILNSFPSWFGSGIRRYLGREEEMPFDQHCLLASIAPRPLLITYALDDRWSNPEGMVQSALAAREAYRFLGVPDNLAFHLRPGEHAHSPEDWETLLDFAAWKWLGKKPSATLNRHPYEHLAPAFSWKAPGI